MKVLFPVEEMLMKLSGTCALNLNALGFTYLSCVLNTIYETVCC